jgi:error-prone DNA polymerase
MAAVLANWGGYYSQRVYLSEARRMGITVRPPHVNYSGRNFVVRTADNKSKMLYMGLDQIKDLTSRTISTIIRGQPFSSLDDFLARVDPRASEAENLAKVGAFDGFGVIPALLKRLQTGSWLPGQMSLFEWEAGPGENDWSLSQKVDAQQALLGASLEAHPLELVASKIVASGAVSTLEAAERVGRRVIVAGIRQTAHRSRTARGEPMMFLTLEDLTGTLDVILFPDVYRRAKNDLSQPVPLLISGVMEMDTDGGEPFLRAERVTRVV